MKIVISHAYSRHNKGDAAIVSVLVDQIKHEFDPAELIILTRDETYHGELFDEVPIESDFIFLAASRYNDKFIKLTYSALMILFTTLWCYVFRLTGKDLWLPSNLRQLVRHYAEADLVIPVGGGYLRGSQRLDSIYNLTLLLHPIVLSSILGTPTVLFTQSVGPFYHTIERILLRVALKRSRALILLREDRSMELLSRLGVSNAIRSVDAGFLFGGGARIDLRQQLGLAADRLLIGFTVRSWLDADQQQGYQHAIAEMIDHVIDRYDAFVVFIPQVTAAFLGDDDSDVGRDISVRNSQQRICACDRGRARSLSSKGDLCEFGRNRGNKVSLGDIRVDILCSSNRDRVRV